jgi:hypothetical protein
MAIGQISEALFLLLIPVFFVTALKNNFSRYVSMGNCYALFAYGNGGDLSFMLIIGIAYTEFVMISFVSGQIYTNSKGENIKVLLKVSLH